MRPSTPASRAWLRERGLWLVPAVLMCTFFAAYAATAQSNSKVRVDVYSSSLAAWHIAETGRPWLDDFDTTTIDGYGSLRDPTVSITEAPNGHRVPHRLSGVVAAPKRTVL